MKIYADENIESAVIEGLRRRRVDVVSAGETGHLGKSDAFHLKKAAELGAAILTHDVDFLRISSQTEKKHAGIIFAHPKPVSVGQCIRGVEPIVRVLTEKDMANHIEFL